MTNGTLILLGNLDSRALHRAAMEFAWSLEKARSFGRLHDLSANHKLVAVLFEPYTFGLSWNVALKSVLDAAPTALPIACHRFSDEIDWPEFAAAGAFHALSLPFHEGELRQSLGFVWAARCQGSSRVPLRPPEKPARSIQVHRKALAVGFVA